MTQILDEWDTPWNFYIVYQFDDKLRVNIDGLGKKKKVVDTLFRKLFIKYEKELIKRYGIKEYQEGLNRIGKYNFEDKYIISENFKAFIPAKNWNKEEFKEYQREIYNKL